MTARLVGDRSFPTRPRLSLNELSTSTSPAAKPSPMSHQFCPPTNIYQQDTSAPEVPCRPVLLRPELAC